MLLAFVVEVQQPLRCLLVKHNESRHARDLLSKRCQFQPFRLFRFFEVLFPPLSHSSTTRLVLVASALIASVLSTLPSTNFFDAVNSSYFYLAISEVPNLIFRIGRSYFRVSLIFRVTEDTSSYLWIIPTDSCPSYQLAMLLPSNLGNSKSNFPKLLRG